MKFHRHMYKYKILKGLGLTCAYAKCGVCNKKTFSPWWPMWKRVYD